MLNFAEKNDLVWELDVDDLFEVLKDLLEQDPKSALRLMEVLLVNPLDSIPYTALISLWTTHEKGLAPETTTHHLIAQTGVHIKEFIVEVKRYPNNLKPHWWGIDTRFKTYFDHKYGDQENDGLIQENYAKTITTKYAGSKETNVSYEYERLILEAQDAIACRDFKSAKGYCLQAKAIYPQSPQIYEYLALIHYRLLTPEEGNREVRSDLLSRRDLDTIIHYVNRCINFAAFSKYCYLDPSATASSMNNLKVIIHAIAMDIQKRYFKKGKSLGDNRAEKIRMEDYGEIWELLSSYLKILRLNKNKLKFLPDGFIPIFFVETAILELSGAGYISWYSLKDRRVRNRYPKMDAKTLLNEYQDVLADTEDERLRANGHLLYDFLQTECGRVNGNTWLSFAQKRQYMLEIISNSVVGYLLYEDGKPFLELILTQLAPSEHQTQTWDWFELGYAGRLQNREEKTTGDVDRYKVMVTPLEALQITSKGLKLNYQEVCSRILTSLIQKSYKRHQSLLASLKPKLDVANPEVESEIVELVTITEKLLGLEDSEKDAMIESVLQVAIPPQSKFQLFEVAVNGVLGVKYRLHHSISNILQQRRDFKQDFVGVDLDFVEQMFLLLQAALVEANSKITFGYNVVALDARRKILQVLRSVEVCFLVHPRRKYLLMGLGELAGSNRLNWSLEEGELMEMVRKEYQEAQQIKNRFDHYLTLSTQ